jgi:hypothetical protein
MNLRRFLARWLPMVAFRDSAAYWRLRYQLGGDSGSGSEDTLACHKAEIVNDLVTRWGVQSVIEWGVGDGRQLALGAYPSYLGLDVSDVALERCRERFGGDPRMRFASVDAYQGETADLALSLDVLYHLVEDEVYDSYLARLFSSSLRWVVVYSSSVEAPLRTAKHVLHRPVEADISARFPEFVRLQGVEQSLAVHPMIDDPLRARFIILERTAS